MNPFQPLYDACNTGDPAEKYASLPSFPRMIDIELTSACNFRCLMCPTGNKSLKREATFMGGMTYKAILDECAPHGTAIRLIGWGEPTMHQAIEVWVAAATERGLLSHLNTNGSKLDRFMIADLIAAGLGSIKLSFQGVSRETFAEMRNIDWFDELIEMVAMVKRIRGDRELPWIAVSTTTTYETAEMIDGFKTRLGALADEVNVGRTIFDFMDLRAARLRPEEKAKLRRLAAAETAEKRHPVPCPEVFDKLSIHADGSVVLCCNDFDGTVTLGNVNDTSIAELWRHPKIEAYRQRLVRKDYDAPLCRDCYDYMGCTTKVNNEHLSSAVAV